MIKMFFLIAGLALLTFNNQAQTVTDIDGNVYNTVTIGTQVWTKENLKVSRYNNGDTIPNVTDSAQWANLTTGAYCNYSNNSYYDSIYGKLYNFYTVVDNRSLCPSGWHVPSDSEWTVLTTFLGGDAVAGGKMKEVGYAHWANPNANADNSSGFTARAGGLRENWYYGLFYNAVFWSSTASNDSSAWFRTLFYNVPIVYRNDCSNNKTAGFSIRCVKNSYNEIQDINHIEELQIYPNPAAERVYIYSAEKQNMEMQFYNMIGECVLQRKLKNNTNEIDISSLSKGIYLIQVTSAKETIQKKLIKK